jgi:protein tyrosine phosphatase (PTP) superfamily phosphohydrolase (DUF442 family)
MHHVSSTRRFVIFTLLILSAALAATEARPAEWAQAVLAPGLPNLHRVSGELYRGAQPEKRGYAELRQLGIRTVVNLRQGEDWERAEVEGAGMRYVSLPTNTFFPRKKRFRAFLALFDDPNNLPVFVHCRHGADRTGAAVALYRALRQDWTVWNALREMTRGGFGFHAIHFRLKGFVRSFVRKERIMRLAKKAISTAS